MQQCSNFGVDLDRNKNEKFLIFIKKVLYLYVNIFCYGR